MPQTRLILRKGREQRQLQGHPWVYEGEIASVRGTPRDGGVADCYSHDEVFLGRGYFNSRSKIRLRVLTRHIAEDVDEALLRRRLSAALGRRRRLYPEAAALRLVHAEGDGLPGSDGGPLRRGSGAAICLAGPGPAAGGHRAVPAGTDQPGASVRPQRPGAAPAGRPQAGEGVRHRTVPDHAAREYASRSRFTC